MTNKTISINPQLFSMSGSKTRKNKEKKEKVNVIPLISPNVLKNKLLKRIKEHKQRETEHLNNNNKTESNIENNNNEIKNYSDEFTDSMTYLQTLSKQKKVNEEKLNYERKKEQKKQELQRQTIKNYSSLHNVNTSSSVVNIDLPEELQINIPPPSEITPLSLNKHDDYIPYSNLKGGNKPTYRTWNKTQRSNIVTNPNLAVTINNTNVKTERENRLHNLRKKLQMKQTQMQEQNLIKHNNTIENQNQNQNQNPTSGQNPIQNQIPTSDQNSTPNQVNNLNEEIIGTKKITKKTIKRKYTLGKSNIKKTVSVLVKDRGTRKQILSAQKDLKKKSINDIKEYLRNHNLIKVGSNAPNDVLRKLYESAMLAGEITNSNSDILLHNILKEDSEI